MGCLQLKQWNGRAIGMAPGWQRHSPSLGVHAISPGRASFCGEKRSVTLVVPVSRSSISPPVGGRRPRGLLPESYELRKRCATLAAFRKLPDENIHAGLSDRD